MSYAAKVGRNGIITIPADLRRRMGISDGDIIVIEQDGAGRAVLSAKKQATYDTEGPECSGC